MLELGTPIYLLMQTGEKGRVLHAGTVLASTAEAVTAEFDAGLTLVAGADMIAMGETHGRLFQQGVCVSEILPGEKPTASFRRVGEIVSAEQRQMFRVSVATAGMTARIDKERICQVVDLSFEGFGAILKHELKIGTIAQVILTHEGKTVFTAPARVQTTKPRPDGTFRHGFLVPKSAADARKAMQQLSGLLQRQQLRRLSGAAA